ncbi:MAG: FAD:protein FMN transferase [Eubacterium sp.]|nr:FAD:protein FMN transferase [Eubacterium sp.]
MKKFIYLTIAAALLLSGCGSNAQSVQVVSVNDDDGEITEEDLATEAETTYENGVKVSKQYVFAMDTEMYLAIYGTECEEAIEAAVEEINRIDDLLSVGDEESEIFVLNSEGSCTLSDETYELIERALEIGDLTAGALDITVYPLMEAWGFTTQDYRVPSESEIKELLEKMGADKISYDEDTKVMTLSEGTMIDLGAIAKGYTSSRLMEIFEEYDVNSAMVSLGGNIHVYGSKTDGSDWNVAIADPEDSSKYLGAVKVSDKCVITSGGYERYFEEDGVVYHHILDPSTGYPADSGVISVTIVSDDGTLADALSTSLFVMGLSKATEFWENHSDEFDFIIETDDGEIYITPGLDGIFSSDSDYNIVE